MCYHHVKGRNRFKQRSFYGEPISADDLNYRKPAPVPCLPSGAPDLVGGLGSRACRCMPDTPLHLTQSVPGL